MPENLTDLIAKRFIARRDVKAIQHRDGSWSPHTTDGKRDSARIPWSRKDLEAHIAGTTTYGHYLLSQDDQVKLFAFDIDLNANVSDDNPNPFQGYWKIYDKEHHDGAPVMFDARECWRDRSHMSRSYTKIEFKLLATDLMAHIEHELEIPCAVAYSGGKGIHVYGFTGSIPAIDAREGAAIVLEALGNWEATRGDNFYRPTNWKDPHTPFRNLTIEVFPKQDSLAGKDLGNLMRLPLGCNFKNPKDPTFFIDMTTPMEEFSPVDPIRALTESPWMLTHA